MGVIDEAPGRDMVRNMNAISPLSGTSPPASGVNPGVSGLIVGTVKQIDQDPQGQNRVLVVAPLIDPQGDGVWARLANAYASNNAGISFMPEVGDDVVLGFLNDDPRLPIVLGSL